MLQKTVNPVWWFKFQKWNVFKLHVLFQCSVITLQSFRFKSMFTAFVHIFPRAAGSFLGRVRGLTFWTDAPKNFDPTLVMLAKTWLKNQEFSIIQQDSWNKKNGFLVLGYLDPKKYCFLFCFLQNCEIQWFLFGGPGNQVTIQTYLLSATPSTSILSIFSFFVLLFLLFLWPPLQMLAPPHQGAGRFSQHR